MCLRLRRRTVRVESAIDAPPARHRPALPSRHENLLRDADVAGGDTWAARAVRQVLAQVRDGHWIEPIAVVDAWREDAETFCLVYTPPWGPDPLVGVRRQRGDLHPVAHIPSDSPHDDSSFATPDDPVEYAAAVVDDISEPLGATRLHRADNGFAWWGTVDGWPLPAWSDDQRRS